MSKSKVYVSQQTLRRSQQGKGPMIQFPSLNPATEFGEVCILLDWYEEKDLTDEQILWRMREKLATFSDADYVLPLGSARAQAAAVLIAAEVNDGCVKILEWDRDSRAYNVRAFDLNAQPKNWRIDA